MFITCLFPAPVFLEVLMVKTLRSFYTKCGPRTLSIGISLKLVRKCRILATSQEQNLHFNKIHGIHMDISLKGTDLE